MNKTYKIRLTFVHICECLVKQIPSELFLASILDTLLALSRDRVANIRVAVARLCRTPYPKWLAADARVASALEQMEHHDYDRDVTWFAKSRSVKARDQSNFCNYQVWVPREGRLKKNGDGSNRAAAVGAGAACAASGGGDDWQGTEVDVVEHMDGDEKGAGADAATQDNASPSCPAESRRPTIEILLQGNRDAAQDKQEGNEHTAVEGSRSAASASSMAVSTSVEYRGRRESALSAGSEVEL